MLLDHVADWKCSIFHILWKSEWNRIFYIYFLFNKAQIQSIQRSAGISGLDHLVTFPFDTISNFQIIWDLPVFAV